MTTTALDSLARVAAGRMINSVIAGLILTILAWSLLRLLPRANARTRVAVWFSVLVAIPGLSLATIFLARTQSLANQSARIIVPEGWALTVFATWALLAGFALLRVAFGLWRIRALRQACMPVELAKLDPAVLATIHEFRPKRSTALLESEQARVPMAVGFFRPAVIIPKWVLAELCPNEISAVLIHEFSHLRRWDDWTNFFQKLVRAVFFFHPSVWWLDRRLALDREIACDDAVLAATNKAHDYARCLVGLAEKSLVRRSLAMAQAAVHRIQHISLRISQILDSSRPRATRPSRMALAGITVLTGICLVAVLQSPTLIAFQGAHVATAAPAVRPAVSVIPARAIEGNSARVVPAVMHEPANRAPRSFAKANKTNVAASRARTRDVVIPAKFRHAAEQQPKILRAGLSARQPSAIPVESIFFLMPDARLNANGQVVWTFSVWRLTVFHPLQAPPVEGSIPNSI